MDSTKQNIAIIGGGIAGLTAAYYLDKKVKEDNLPYNVILIESTTRLGGKMQTVERDGFVIERGPDSFLARKKSMTELAKEVGLESTIVPNSTGKSYILVKDNLHPIPGGSVMGIPTEIGPFITTGLFSLSGKMRAAMDFILPRSKEPGDQPLGKFLRRRLGDEIVENLVEPLLSGIYAGDLDKLSTMSTFPDMLKLEKKYRSIVLGTKKNRPKKPVSQDNKSAGDSKIGMFRTFNKGLQSLTDAIEAKLPANQILKGTRVDGIIKTGEGYMLTLNNGDRLPVISAILATPHQAVPQMLPDYGMFEPFKVIPSTSVATVSMAFDASAIKEDIDGTGFLVSRNSDYTITACTWTHKKWPHTTPHGKVLLRCYVGRAGDEVVVDLSDGEIEQIVLDDLNRIMQITEKPDFTIVTRWNEGMPQYEVGHLDRLKMIKERMDKELPGIYLAGASYHGIGMPDCIDQGIAAMNQVLTFIKEKNL
ncbi:protoporphyrinogen oxidase [Pradoshia sp. D12]|uniref:protoporphyrinogen oxidase n=1 Tax=Bacillaceae TaxID=186817 RepID=UPI0011274416|nr:MULTISPECIES: protoporphyrinogen oxidase [Bacillaceae]QFK70496.1 protoporphyrinogen oxidase [Pradoshia sp. D12]TPF72291.1 protoporphyrinogen oxidase [Bacillus sp. D12]